MGEHKLISILFFGLTLLFSKSSLAHDEFINVIAESKASVVILEITRSKKKSKAVIDALGDSADFFQEDLSELRDLPRNSHGSGFVVKHERLQLSSPSILTAAHVVRGASKITVSFSSGQRKLAKVVWLNRRNDIALLQVSDSVDDFPEGLSLSDSAVLEGQSVLSIAGSFVGLSVGSSLGIVSAIDVRLPNKKKLSLIQTDAAINPGSSGGPLLDNRGKVVGVISNIYTKTGTFSGAAFAVPATTVLELIDKQHEK